MSALPKFNQETNRSVALSLPSESAEATSRAAIAFGETVEVATTPIARGHVIRLNRDATVANVYWNTGEIFCHPIGGLMPLVKGG